MTGPQTTQRWRVIVAALIAWAPCPLAAIGAALGWNAYIVLILALGCFTLVFTMAASLSDAYKKQP